MSKPASRSTRALRSSIALHQMKSSTSGWSASRMTILAARRVLPPDLMVPADASAPRMKLTGPEAVPPPFEQLVRRADARQVDAGARAALEDDPLLGVPVEDRVHRVLDREDEAVVDPQAVAQVLAALGLDVVDVHLPSSSMRSISSRFVDVERWPTSSRLLSSFIGLDRVDEADLVWQTSIRSPERPGSSVTNSPCRSGRVSALNRTREKIPKRAEECLGAPDDRPRRSCRMPTTRERSRTDDVPLGLEDAPEVGRDHRQRCRRRGARAPSSRGRRGRRSHRSTKSLRASCRRAESVGSPVTGPDRRHACAHGDARRGRPCPWREDPRSLGIGHRHGFDGQRPVRPCVLTDETVRLQPSGQGRFGDLATGDLRRSEGLGPVPAELVAGRRSPAGTKRRCRLVARLPDQVVGR